MFPIDTPSATAGRRLLATRAATACLKLAATVVLLTVGVAANGAPVQIGPGRPGFDPDRAVAASLSAGEVAYDNLASPLDLYVGGFAYEEVADDVFLTGASRILESVTVAYAGFNFDGDETLTLSLYSMDGPPTPGSFGFNTPGTLLLSRTVPIAATAGTTITFLDASGSLVLPDVVGVGVAFGGVDFNPTGPGSDAGALLYDPPAAGSSFDDYWLRGFPNPGDPWAIFTFGGNPPINLGVKITTVQSVPEPATLFLLATGVGLGAAFRLRRRNR